MGKDKTDSLKQQMIPLDPTSLSGITTAAPASQHHLWPLLQGVTKYNGEGQGSCSRNCHYYQIYSSSIKATCGRDLDRERELKWLGGKAESNQMKKRFCHLRAGYICVILGDF